jgi:hypothetical protein
MFFKMYHIVIGNPSLVNGGFSNSTVISGQSQTKYLHD